jgi:hypothetical protein
MNFCFHLLMQINKRDLIWAIMGNETAKKRKDKKQVSF